MQPAVYQPVTVTTDEGTSAPPSYAPSADGQAIPPPHSPNAAAVSAPGTNQYIGAQEVPQQMMQQQPQQNIQYVPSSATGYAPVPQQPPQPMMAVYQPGPSGLAIAEGQAPVHQSYVQQPVVYAAAANQNIGVNQANQQIPLSVATGYSTMPQAQQPVMMVCPPGHSAPMKAQTQPQAPPTWRYGLCECFDDFGTCCKVCWCPCLAAGDIWEQGLEKSWLSGCGLFLFFAVLPVILSYISQYMSGIPFLTFLYPFLWTGKLRESRAIRGSYIEDCCSFYWCGLCHMTRDVREAKAMQEERLQAAQMPVQTAMV